MFELLKWLKENDSELFEEILELNAICDCRIFLNKKTGLNIQEDESVEDSLAKYLDALKKRHAQP